MNITIGICSDCGRKFEPTNPRIGYFCETLIEVDAKDENKQPIKVTKRCKGAAVRHRLELETISGI